MVESLYQKTRRHPERSEEGKFNNIYYLLFHRVFQNNVPSVSDNSIPMTHNRNTIYYLYTGQKSYFAKDGDYISGDVKLTLLWQ
jgi:hypothetical protein